MKTIGILGGLGPESTIEYYGHITREYYKLRSDYAYPEIIIHSFNFKEFIDTGYVKPVEIKQAILNLHQAGADFVVAACNSVHIVYEEVSKDIPIPWVSIMDAAAEQIKNQGISKVALLGTIFTMNSDFFPKALADWGIEAILPDADDKKTISEIIYGELVRAEVKDDSRQVILGIIDKMKSDDVEAVILGCTELPFLIRSEDTTLPVFDTTVIHAQKALDLAME